MRLSTSKIGDLLSHFDKIDESEAQLKKFSLKQLLTNNYDVAVNEGKIRKQLPHEFVHGFYKTI